LSTFLIILAIVAGIFLFFFVSRRLEIVKENKRGWRTKSLGRSTIFYQEKIDNEWKSIEIDGEMLVGKISKVLYFKNDEEWRDYPKWAQNRKEIIGRIKQDWPPSRTDYENE